MHFGESKALSLFQTETVATIFGVSPRLVQCRRGWGGLSDVPTSVQDVITVEDVRRIASSLPRSYEVVVRDRIKFRVGRIVYVAFSPDETVMGFAFPKEERAALVASEPDKFMLPSKSDMRYNWIHVRLDAIDLEELRELVIDAWRMCVPKKVAATVLDVS